MEYGIPSGFVSLKNLKASVCASTDTNCRYETLQQLLVFPTGLSRDSRSCATLPPVPILSCDPLTSTHSCPEPLSACNNHTSIRTIKPSIDVCGRREPYFLRRYLQACPQPYYELCRSRTKVSNGERMFLKWLQHAATIHRFTTPCSQYTPR